MSNTALVRRGTSSLVAADKQCEQTTSTTYTVCNVDDEDLNIVPRVPWDGLKGPSKWVRTEIIHRYEYLNANAHIGTPAADKKGRGGAGKKSKQSKKSKRQGSGGLIHSIGKLMLKISIYGFILLVFIKMMEG